MTDCPDVNPPKPGAAGTPSIGFTNRPFHPDKPYPLKATQNPQYAVGVVTALAVAYLRVMRPFRGAYERVLRNSTATPPTATPKPTSYNTLLKATPVPGQRPGAGAAFAGGGEGHDGAGTAILWVFVGSGASEWTQVHQVGEGLALCVCCNYSGVGARHAVVGGASAFF